MLLSVFLVRYSANDAGMLPRTTKWPLKYFMLYIICKINITLYHLFLLYTWSVWPHVLSVSEWRAPQHVIRLPSPGALNGLHHCGLPVHPPVSPQSRVTVIRPRQPVPDDWRLDGGLVEAHGLLSVRLVPVLGHLDLVVEVLVLGGGGDDLTIALAPGPAGQWWR